MDLKGKKKMSVGDILVLLVYLDSDLGFNKSLNDNMTEWANIYIFYFISQFIAANLVRWFEVTTLRNVVKNKQTMVQCCAGVPFCVEFAGSPAGSLQLPPPSGDVHGRLTGSWAGFIFPFGRSCSWDCLLRKIASVQRRRTSLEIDEENLLRRHIPGPGLSAAELDWDFQCSSCHVFRSSIKGDQITAASWCLCFLNPSWSLLKLVAL